MSPRPMFERRHYEAIAHNLRSAEASVRTAAFLGSMFCMDNPKYEHIKFMTAACGFTSDKPYQESPTPSHLLGLVSTLTLLFDGMETSDIFEAIGRALPTK